MTYKLRFFADFCLALTASQTLIRGSQDQSPTLAKYIDVPGVYAAGRLDKDSEGLLVLTDDGKLQNKITSPALKMSKTYWAQVEGQPSEKDLEPLRQCIQLKDGMALPAKVGLMDTPDVWDRNPPIRERKNIPTQWLRISIKEGRNRQVRRMTAAAGFPTLRLIRYSVGSWTLDGIASGEFLQMEI